ncbi:serine/threonine-protein kinase SMG1-like [Convolutriloba macropyga]|uniref:serine/threonine-protein kinase SMG1-like n=1 Tax=Convolutriloba macropyga TaxID=536237 RepID=UPI003F51D10D
MSGGRKALPPRLANRAGGSASFMPASSDPGGYRSYQPYHNPTFTPYARDPYEDHKLNGLLRKVLREDITSRSLAPDLKLVKEYIENPANARLVVKMSESAMNKLQELYYKEINKSMKFEVAEVIGMLGHASIQLDPFKFNKWVFDCIYGAPSEQVKLFYLFSLQKTIELDVKTPEMSKLQNVITECTDNLCKILSEVDDYEMLMAVVNCLLVIATAYKSAMFPHLEETMDIIIGWRLEPETSQKVLNFTSKALVSFGDLWASNSSHTVKIFGQFIDDIEAYRSDIAKLETSSHEQIELIKDRAEIFDKIIELIGVFGLLVKSLKQHAVNNIFKPVIQNSLKRIFDCVSGLSTVCLHMPLIRQTNALLAEFMKSVPVLVIGDGSVESGNAGGIVESVFTYLLHILEIDPNFSVDLISNCLSTLKEVIKPSTGQIPLPLLETLLVDNLHFRKLRCCEDEQIMALALGVYESLLFIKDVATLETIYKIMLSEIQVCAHILIDDVSSDLNELEASKGVKPSFQLVSEVSDPYNFVPGIREGNAVEIIEFNLTALLPLSSQKNSLIVNYALKPSLFNLFCKSLRVLCVDYGKIYPEIQYSILCLLYQHSSASSHYVATCSTGSSKSSPVAKNAFSFSQPTKNHFFDVCDLLSAVLSQQTLHPNSLSIILPWLSEVLSAMQHESSIDAERSKRIINHAEFRKLTDKVFAIMATVSSGEVHNLFVHFVIQIVNMQTLSTDCLDGLATMSLIMMLHNNPAIVSAYSKIFSQLPAGCLVDYKVVRKQGLRKCDPMLDHRKMTTHIMRMEPSSQLVNYDFKFILNGVMTEIATKQQINGENLETFFYRYANQDALKSAAVSNWRNLVQFQDVSWFYALWEVANICITGKLKTALGKANETFSEFEGVLRSHCAAIRSSPVEEKERFGPLTLDNVQSLGKPRRMLLFLDCLEKQIYNASEGLMCSLPVANKAARTFFRTNKAVCRIWYQQIRVLAACIARAIQDPCSVIYHVTTFFADLKPTEKVHPDQILDLCLMLYWAYIECKAPDALHGFNVFFQKRFGKSFPCADIFLLHSKGYYEDAMYLYICKLRNEEPNSELIGFPSLSGISQKSQQTSFEFGEKPLFTKFLFTQYSAIAESMRCLEELQEFCDNFKSVIEANETQKSLAIEVNEEVKYVEALKSFRSLEFLNVREPESLIPQNDQDVVVKHPQWATQNLSRGIELCLLNGIEQGLPKALLEGSTNAGVISEVALKNLSKIIPWSSSQLCSNVPKTVINRFQNLAKLTSMVPALSITEEDRKLLKLNCAISFSQTGTRADSHQFESWFRGLEMENLKRSVLGRVSNESETRSKAIRESVLKNTEDVSNLIRMLRKSTCPRIASQMLLDSKAGYRVEIDKSALITSLNNNFKLTMNDPTMVKIELNQIKESAKLLSIFGDVSGSCYKLSSLILLFMKNANIGEASFISKVISNLIKVLVSESGKNVSLDANGESFSPVGRLSSDLRDLIGTTAHFTPLAEAIAGNSAIDERESVVAALHYLSLGFEPENSKTWYRLASWSFKFGKKTVTQACTEAKILSDLELEEVDRILKMRISDETKRNSVIEILQRPHFSALQDEDIVLNEVGRLEPNCNDMQSVVARQILAVAKELKHQGSLELLMNIWQNACNRVFALYKLSAEAYFKYLTLDSHLGNDAHVTATLRLLRLLVNHASELKDCLETGLKITPTKPWCVIIPQLFSRLNHPEAYVRKSVTDLLKRIANSMPQLVVYPVIVGCEQKISEGKVRSKSGRLGSGDKVDDSQEESTQKDDRKGSPDFTESGIGSTSVDGKIVNSSANQNETTETVDDVMSGDTGVVTEDSQDEQEKSDDNEDDDDEDEEEEVDLNDLYSSRAEIEHCYSVLLETVSQRDSQLVSDLKLFVDELRRLSVLWDELWLSAFMYYSNEAIKAINMIDCERKRLDKNKSLSNVEKLSILNSKYAAYMNPVIFVFEQILELSSRAPETSHENWFAANFLDKIKEALKQLKKPDNIRKPHPAWEKFNQVYQELSARSSKKSSLDLQLKLVSPKLLSFKNSSVPLILSETSELITIQSFNNDVLIMPTKTKPKKITILGNNGQVYSYLFKGLEDLHLDERIMQFLTIVNTMFDKDNKAADNCFYRARNYAVTPLGPRSGLIQWVDGSVPLFGIYKKWQQREAYAATLKSQSVAANQPGGTQSGGNQKGPGSTATETSNLLQMAPVPKPSEIFLEKITACLTANGLSESTPRKEWPIKVVRQALDQLQKATPNCLLWRELWCSCSNSDEWWLMRQQYNTCTAVMSVVGYIIGLGDRHLDNILVDLKSGEIVHIDYNVCFEKGKNLRVPERVPFRLTQNLEAALGVTGPEGHFRIAAETVMRTLRRGRETLLTLLEAFVYDPLVDWTTHSSDLGGFMGALQFKKGNESLRIEKKNLDFQVAHSLLCAKIVEIKGSWVRNRDEVLNVLRSLPERLQILTTSLSTHLEGEKRRAMVQSAQKYIKDAENDDSHIFWTLQMRDANAVFYRNIEDEFTASLNSQIVACESTVEKVMDVFSNTNRMFLMNALSDFSSSSIPDPGYPESRAYLANVRQLQLLEDCQQAESESTELLKSQNVSCLQLAKLLADYLTIVKQMETPTSYVQNIIHCLQLIKSQSENTDSDAVDESEEEIEAIKMDELKEALEPPVESAAQAIQIDNGLITELRSCNDAIVRLSSKLHSITPDVNPGESRTALNERLLDYISKSPKEFSSAAASVVLNYLTTFASQYIHMEVAAFSATDEALKNSKSVGGDWFLDEVESLATTLKSLATFVQYYINMHTDYNAMPSETIEPVASSLSMYTAVMDFYTSVSAQVVPEVFSHLLSTPLSSHDLEQLAEKLTTIQAEAEDLLTTIEMTSENDETSYLEITAGMEALVTGVTSLPSSLDSVLPLVFQAFNELSGHLESMKSKESEAPDEMEGMLSHFKVLRVAEKVERALNVDVRASPNWRTWLKCASVKAISSFLLSIVQTVCSVKTLKVCDMTNKSSENNLRQVQQNQALQCLDPMRLFVASFVRKQIIGTPSKRIADFVLHCAVCLGVTSAVELCDYTLDRESAEEVKLEFIDQKVRSSLKKNKQITEECFNQVLALFSDLESECRRATQVASIENQLNVQRCQFQLLSTITNRFEWSYHHLLVLGGKSNANDFLTNSRLSVLESIQAKLLEVTTLNSKTSAAVQSMRTKEDKIEARLKWSAGLYQDTLSKFTSLKVARDSFCQERMKQVEQLITSTKLLLQFEQMQTYGSQMTQSLASGCRDLIELGEKLRAYKGRKVDMSSVEKFILTVLSATSINVKSTEDCRSKIAHNLQTEDKQAKSRVDITWQALLKNRDELKSSIQPLKVSLNAHNATMKELKSLMRPLNKEDAALGRSIRGVLSQVRNYVMSHNQFTGSVTRFYSILNPIIANVASLKRDQAPLDELKRTVEELVKITPSVYSQMLDLSQTIDISDAARGSESTAIELGTVSKRSTNSKDEDTTLFASESFPKILTASKKDNLSAKKGIMSAVGTSALKRDPRTGKALQERNSYAISVWRKVRAKLDGVVEVSLSNEPNAMLGVTKRLNVSDHIDLIIKEAVDQTNLAQMYEGWTAWV